MPVILRYKGYKFYFFSNEGEPLEPPHVHVRKDECQAKFWLKPVVSLDESYGFSATELNELLKVVEENRELMEAKWNEHFNR